MHKRVIIPRIVNCIYPEYPKNARALGIEGTLVVIYNISNLGKIENIRILSAIPVGIFEKNVRSAMRRWMYETDKPRKDLIITFKFRLKSVEIFDNKKFK